MLPSPPRPACTSMPARSWNMPALLGGLCDFDEAALAALLERDRSGTRREDRVAAAESGPRTRSEPRAALADEDHPGLDILAGEDLDAEHLRVRAAAVGGRAESFFVCHYCFSLFVSSVDSSAASAPFRFAFARSYSSAASTCSSRQCFDFSSMSAIV